VVFPHLIQLYPLPEQDDPATRDALCSAAKSMLIYEKMHIRKFYLQHPLWTIPHQDLVIYNYDYYDRYKYNAGRSSPAMHIQDCVNMCHQKKMQYYLCQCKLSWSYVFTGVVQPPENVEDTTTYPCIAFCPHPIPFHWYHQNLL
jgi:hypothetical protein